jgi:hypothetical protein
MAKKKDYFSHDFFARQDTDIMGLLAKHGMEGYGVYWSIVEIMHQNNGVIHISTIDGIASNLKVSVDVLNDILSHFGLFRKTKTTFYSERVKRNLQEICEKSDKARLSANMRWESERNANALPPQQNKNANALPPQCDPNAIKLKVSKLKKDNNNKLIPRACTREKIMSLIGNDYGYVTPQWKTSVDNIINTFSEFIDKKLVDNIDFTYSGKLYTLLSLKEMVENITVKKLSQLATQLKNTPDIKDEKYYIIGALLGMLGGETK